MTDNRYNGWTNRETWLINIHFNPETKADVAYAQEQVEEWYDSLNAFMRDMVDIGCIDWQQLSDNMDEEETYK